MKKAYCVNLGCSENHLDGALISNYLETNDWELDDDPETADLIIVNSCGFSEETERKSISSYQELLLRKRSDAQVIFAGCLPAINKQAVRAAGYEGVLVTPRKLHLLDSVTSAHISIDSFQLGCVPYHSDNIGISFGKSALFPWNLIQKPIKLVAFLDQIPSFKMPRWLRQVLYTPDKDAEFIRISIGCKNICSFCSIPRSKGSTKSVPPTVVLEKVKDAVSRGKKHIVLSCDELASYGQDLGTDIVSLLDKITGLPEQFYLILRNVHPEWMIKYWAGLEPIF